MPQQQDQPTQQGSHDGYDPTHPGENDLLEGVLDVLADLRDVNSGLVGLPSASGPSSVSWHARVGTGQHKSERDDDMDVILGSYPMEPDDPGQRRRFFELLGVAGLYGGLELPYYANGGVPWPQGAPPDWRVVVTAIPGTMQRMSADPMFGLASVDTEGRGRAMDFAAGIQRYVAAMVAAGHPVVAVQFHSAPRVFGRPDALAESLAVLAAWDWSGAKLVLEHCDAPRPSWAPEKGFLELDDEITAVAAAAGTPLGIAINWARSAIEGRSAETALRHIEDARTAGVLSGVMFSGCSPVATRFGHPWIDAHLPAREVEGAPSSSLLTADLIRACVVAAGPADYVGLKISLRPASLGVEARVARLATMAKTITESAAAHND